MAARLTQDPRTGLMIIPPPVEFDVPLLRDAVVHWTGKVRFFTEPDKLKKRVLVALCDWLVCLKETGEIDRCIEYSAITRMDVDRGSKALCLGLPDHDFLCLFDQPEDATALLAVIQTSFNRINGRKLPVDDTSLKDLLESRRITRPPNFIPVVPPPSSITTHKDLVAAPLPQNPADPNAPPGQPGAGAQPGQQAGADGSVIMDAVAAAALPPPAAPLPVAVPAPGLLTDRARDAIAGSGVPPAAVDEDTVRDMNLLLHLSAVELGRMRDALIAQINDQRDQLHPLHERYAAAAAVVKEVREAEPTGDIKLSNHSLQQEKGALQRDLQRLLVQLRALEDGIAAALEDEATGSGPVFGVSGPYDDEIHAALVEAEEAEASANAAEQHLKRLESRREAAGARTLASGSAATKAGAVTELHSDLLRRDEDDKARLQSQIGELQARLAELKEKNQRLRRDYETAAQRAAEERQATAVGNGSRLRDQQRSLTAALQEAAEAEEGASRARRRLLDLSEELTDAKKDALDAEDERFMAQHRVERLLNEVEEVGGVVEKLAREAQAATGSLVNMHANIQDGHRAEHSRLTAMLDEAERDAADAERQVDVDRQRALALTSELRRLQAGGTASAAERQDLMARVERERARRDELVAERAVLERAVGALSLVALPPGVAGTHGRGGAAEGGRSYNGLQRGGGGGGGAGSRRSRSSTVGGGRRGGGGGGGHARGSSAGAGGSRSKRTAPTSRHDPASWQTPGRGGGGGYGDEWGGGRDTRGSSARPPLVGPAVRSALKGALPPSPASVPPRYGAAYLGGRNGGSAGYGGGGGGNDVSSMAAEVAATRQLLDAQSAALSMARSRWADQQRQGRRF